MILRNYWKGKCLKMLDVEKIRKDFPMLSREHIIQGHPLVYLDNAATMFKPLCVKEKIDEYYFEYTGNPHGEDYELAQRSKKEYENAREIIAKFINAKHEEVIFTAGASAALNTVAYALGETLKKGDEVLLTQAEHASNVLPWFKVKEERGIEVNYIPLDEEGRCTLENLKKVITPKTKVISIAHVTNVLGFIVDVKAICKYAHEKGIIVAIDGAQSAPHIKIDVKDIDCDFYSFAGHKMCGPTGVGVLYGKYELLDKLNPLMIGGGTNTRFDTCGDYLLVKPPLKFEAGTPNVEGAIGLGAAITYLESIGLDNIHKYEIEMKEYAIKRLKAEVPGITIYNEHSESGIITFNLKNVFAQDAATHFNSYGICVRAGQHCAKILMDYLHTVATVRCSIGFYNTKQEIDYFVEVAKKGEEFLDAFFK
jgi:cysteine desulfurase/selenocysteine lyase